MKTMSKSASSLLLLAAFAVTARAGSLWPANGTASTSMFADRKAAVAGDILTVVGDGPTVSRIVADLGHPSTVRLVADRSALDRVLPEIAARGYATTPPLPGEQALGFAVPIRSGHAVLGCITLRYFGKALSEHQVAARYLAPLQDMAAVIAANQRLGVAEDA